MLETISVALVVLLPALLIISAAARVVINAPDERTLWPNGENHADEKLDRRSARQAPLRCRIFGHDWQRIPISMARMGGHHHIAFCPRCSLFLTLPEPPAAKGSANFDERESVPDHLWTRRAEP